MKSSGEAGLHGVIPAIVTPFTRGGASVDFDWVPAHLEFLQRNGADAVLASGTTGEGPSLTTAERKRLVDVVVKHKGSLAVVIGSGCAALPDTIELSKYSLERGADTVLIVPPFYFKNVSSAALADYYRAVFRALPKEKQVMLYNIPAVSGVEISNELVDTLQAELPQQLAGIKDTSGKLERTTEYIRRYPGLKIFAGSDTLASAALKAGAAGSFSATSNVFPHLMKAVHEAHRCGGNVADAQSRLTRAKELLYKYPIPSALKHALHILGGLPVTHVRPPSAELSREQAKSLKTELEAFMDAEKATPSQVVL